MNIIVTNINSVSNFRFREESLHATYSSPLFILSRTKQETKKKTDNKKNTKTNAVSRGGRLRG